MASVIIYFSKAGENFVDKTIKTLSVGNTQVAAEILAELTGAELFKIEPEQPYADDYDTCIAQALLDRRRNRRPAVKALPADMDKYDTVFIGYPNYWGTMPMHMFTALEALDLSGKTLRPFCTHEGSGFTRSIDDLKRLCPHSNVLQGLEIRGSLAADCKNKMEDWLKNG